jgi:hypothetical protein
MIEDENQAARVVVEQHPDFDEPITLVGLPEDKAKFPRSPFVGNWVNRGIVRGLLLQLL